MAADLDADKVLARIEALSTYSASSYDLLLRSLVGKCREEVAISRKNIATREFAKFADRACSSSLAIMMTLLETNMKDIEKAMASAEVELFSEIEPDMLIGLRIAYDAQMRIDTAAIKSDLLIFSLSVNAQMNTGKSIISAIVSASKGRSFKFVDRAGRSLKSERYIKAVTKLQVIRAIYISFAATAIRKQCEHLRLSNGSIISINDIEQFTHPNAKVLPVQIVK